MTTTTPDSFVPRLATEDDIPVLVELIRAAFAPVAEMLEVTEETLPQFAAYTAVESLNAYIEKFSVQMFLLSVGGRAVACGGYSPDRGGKPKAWLNRIAVDPDCQGRGYGKAIVAFLEGQLREEGCKRVRLGHVTADAHLHAFYEWLGYETVETQISEAWQMEVTYMEKEL